MSVVSRTLGISSAPLSVRLTISAKRLAQSSWFFAWILIILWDIFHQTSKYLSRLVRRLSLLWNISRQIPTDLFRGWYLCCRDAASMRHFLPNTKRPFSWIKFLLQRYRFHETYLAKNQQTRPVRLLSTAEMSHLEFSVKSDLSYLFHNTQVRS